MLQLDKITKRFTDGQRQLTVLDGLCLHVDEGEFIAITGESGSGKTTLLSILGTLMPIDGGRYLMRGEEVTVDSNKSPSEKIWLSVLFVHKCSYRDRPLPQNS